MKGIRGKIKEDCKRCLCVRKGRQNKSGSSSYTAGVAPGSTFTCSKMVRPNSPLRETRNDTNFYETITWTYADWVTIPSETPIKAVKFPGAASGVAVNVTENALSPLNGTMEVALETIEIPIGVDVEDSESMKLRRSELEDSPLTMKFKVSEGPPL